MSFFLFPSRKQENRNAEQILPVVGGGCWYQWEGGESREKGRRVNTVQKINVYTCM
jgi:hypothetical protein